MTPEVFEFLRGTLKNVDEDTIRTEFECIYGDSQFTDATGSQEQKSEKVSIDKFRKALGLVIEQAPNMPLHFRQFTELDSDGTIAAMKRLLDRADNYAAMGGVFDNNTKIRGSDRKRENAIAWTLKAVFDAIGKPAKYGSSGLDGGPSTPFGKVMLHALEYHGCNSDWDSLTKRYREKPQKKRGLRKPQK